MKRLIPSQLCLVAMLAFFAAHLQGAVYKTADPGKGTANIVYGGKPRAIVVVAENPMRPAHVAAKEFMYYVKKMTGVDLPIVVDAVVPKLSWSPRRVLIGESELTREYGLKNSDFKVQEYLIQTRGQDLILMGRDAEEYGLISYEKNGLWPAAAKRRRRQHPCFVPMGSLYAVDTFLEKYCGVRWYLPGEVGEVCPQHEKLVFTNLNLRTKPWTRYRWSSRLSYREPFHFYGSREQDKLVKVPSRDMILWMLRVKMGGSRFACNHSFTSYYRRFGKQHPKWWKEGKPSRKWPHPDYINPELIKQAAQDALDYFAGKYPEGKYPDGSGIMTAGDYFAVMPLDGRRGLIWSPEAEKMRNRDPAVQSGFSCGWASDYVFTVADAVARIVGKRYPDKWITCCAYAPYFFPPVTPKILAPNLAVMQCGFLNSATDPESWRLYADNLKAWSRRTKELYVWEYYLKQWFAKFRAFPVVFPHQVARGIRHMKSAGVRGMFFEASAAPAKKGPWSDATLANPAEDLLNHYVTWKYLCDDSQDIDALLDEHYRLFYGPAAQPMKTFFQKTEAAWHLPLKAKGKTDANRRYWEIMCPPKALKEYSELMKKASALAAAEPFASRVRLMNEAVYKRMEKNCLAHAARFKGRVRMSCPVLADAPAVDGKLDEPFWRRAAKTSPFGGLTVEKPVVDTVAYVACDGKLLYVAFDCPEPRMDQLKAPGAKRDSPDISRDDHVEIFVDVDRTREKYYRFIIGASGVVRERAVGLALKKGPRGWRSGALVKTWRGPDRWTVEAAIPLKSIGASPKPGDVWGLNLSRLRRAGIKDLSGRKTWLSIPPTGFHSPNEFGVLLIASPVGVGAEKRELSPVVAIGFEDKTIRDGANISAGPGSKIGAERLTATATLKRRRNGTPWDASVRVKGKAGTGFAFDREAIRHIQVNYPEEFGLSRDDFTVMLWFKTSSEEGGYLLSSTTSAPLWILTVGPVKGMRQLRFLFATQAPTLGLSADAPPPDNKWHHVAVTVDRGSRATIYVEGERKSSLDIRAHKGALKNMVNIAGAYNHFHGALDAVQIYKGALDPGEVKKIFAAQNHTGK